MTVELNKRDILTLINGTHLFTKENVYDKPTYDTLKMALVNLKNWMVENDKHKLAIPYIGDRLRWSEVKPIIENVFKDTDIEIEVRHL